MEVTEVMEMAMPRRAVMAHRDGGGRRGRGAEKETCEACMCCMCSRGADERRAGDGADLLLDRYCVCMLVGALLLVYCDACWWAPASSAPT